MECADLCSFWNKNEGSIAKALPEGTVALADSLKTGAEKFKLTQKIDGDIISWSNQEDKTVLILTFAPKDKAFRMIFFWRPIQRLAQPISFFF